MDYLIPFLVVGTFAAVLFLALTHGLPHRRDVLRLVWLGLIVRLVLAAVFQAVPATRIFHEDAEGYEWVAIYMARYWKGDGPYFSPNKLENYGYYYWNAILYYVFGDFRLHAAFFNGLCSCVTAILLYRLCAKYFVEPVARRAFLCALFFPSMILWSSIAVKDTVMVLLITACMYSTVAIQRKMRIGHLVVIVGALVAMFTIRFYMCFLAGLAITASLTLFSRRLGRSIAVQLSIVMVLAVAVVFLGLRREAQQSIGVFDFEKVAALRNGLASTANSGFMVDVDVSTPGRALAFMPIGVVFMLLSPFPWQLTSLRAWLTVPEMLIWWPMTFLWIRGLIYVVARKRSELMPIVVFPVIVTIAYSTVHGNAGVAFRQRAQAMTFLFALAAIGAYVRKLKRNRLSLNLVENDAMREEKTQAEAAEQPLRWGYGR
jgi:4-amino-4-deoxy-L-arabinose transferase-like glycosyltransferase